MTLADAYERAMALEEHRDDPELGHIQLDALLEDLLAEIADCADDEVARARELARTGVLAISKVPERWCA